MGPDELVRVADVARRYYIEGATRVEIAEELGLSRFKVGRMIERAREHNLVKITIEPIDSVDPKLSISLSRHLGLRRAIAVVVPQRTTEAMLNDLGSATARLLTEIVTEQDVLGLTVGRMAKSVADHLDRLAPCRVVQIAGLAAASPQDGVEIMRRVSELTHGSTHPIFAPLLMENAATAAALRREPTVLDAIRRFDSVTTAVVSVGSWDPPDSRLYEDASRFGYLDEILGAGVIGGICATLMTPSGRVVDMLDDRAVAISTRQLQRVPEVIAAAPGGADRTAAIMAVVRSGIVTSLVTDTDTAQRLIRDYPPVSPSTKTR